MTATNGVGTGPPSPASQFTSNAVPSAPTNVIFKQSCISLTAGKVTWTKPTFDGGVPITGYTIKCFQASTNVFTSPTPIPAATACPTITSCSSPDDYVTGLTKNTAYTCTVTAANGIGDSLESTASAAIKTYFALNVGDTMVTYNMAYTYGVFTLDSTGTVRLIDQAGTVSVVIQLPATVTSIYYHSDYIYASDPINGEILKAAASGLASYTTLANCIGKPGQMVDSNSYAFFRYIQRDSGGAFSLFWFRYCLLFHHSCETGMCCIVFIRHFHYRCR